MKLAVIQFEPKLGLVDKNMSEVDSMISDLKQGDEIDLLVLSEMVFTGYVFKNKQEVQLLAEYQDSKAFNWCQKHASRLKCIVACGYIEKTKSDDNLYNSMMVVSPAGELVFNTRKKFLYETDKSWAVEGKEFGSWYCPWLNKTISFGICMDINPYDFVAPFEAYEFANFAKEKSSDLIVFSCAWNDYDPESDDPFTTIQYWTQRLSPIIESLRKDQYSKPNCYFVCSNRVGIENGVNFVGSSCILSLKEPCVLEHAGRRDQKVLITKIE